MCNRWLTQRLFCFYFLFYLTPGCTMFHSDQTVTVLVRDAETMKPITTAEVYLCQCLPNDEVAPCYSKGLTQTDGIARLRTEPASEQGIQVQTVAQGYLPEKLDVFADVFKKNASAPSSQPIERRPADVIVDVYSEPNFSVELVLPAGYRGLVKAEVQIRDDLPLPAGQRCFRYPVSASGDVLVTGPSLLRRVPASEFRARYGNGPFLGTAMDAEKVGFRLLKSLGSQQYFVVGTQLDYEKVHRQVAPEEAVAASGSFEDPAWTNRSHKYRYGKVTAPSYEK
ncbi:MAG TPA: hypothetical protein VMF69_16575 [Gemmataceae bacterium]|nr:hypothetical protein [Gemmataceae bacterium]